MVVGVKKELIPERPQIEVASLPPGSWCMQFQFTLERPIVTKDEIRLDMTENPVRRERATGIPCFVASSWKGSLRSAFRATSGNGDSVQRDFHSLFGSAERVLDSETKEPRRGRLQFFSTYFDMAGVYLTQALNRKTKTGDNPVNYEVVPEGAKGWFTLLYCTHADGILNPAGIEEESGRHARMMASTVAVMFRQTGFGGKKSSGFGMAADLIDDGVFLERDKSARFTHLTHLDAWQFKVSQ